MKVQSFSSTSQLLDWRTGLIHQRSNWIFVSDVGSRVLVYTCIYGFCRCYSSRNG